MKPSNNKENFRKRGVPDRKSQAFVGCWLGADSSPVFSLSNSGLLGLDGSAGGKSDKAVGDSGLLGLEGEEGAKFDKPVGDRGLAGEFGLSAGN